eukprot:6358488-Alexandrium_andersonii.AAC.1
MDGQVTPVARVQLSAPFNVLCPRGCGTTLQLASKPRPQRGEWPKVHCWVCARTARVGAALCTACRQKLK